MAEDTALVVDKPRIQELYRFGMYTDAPDNSGKKSRLAWSVRDSNPRITVYTNVASDANISYGIISAPFNPETFMVFLSLFEKIIKGEKDNKYKIDCFTQYKKDGVLQERMLLSEVWFGKDADGIVWISLLAPNRPKIRFNFMISDFHKIYKGDGNPFNDSEASMLHALAVCTTLRDVYAQYVGTIRQPNPNSNSYDAKKSYNTTKPATNQPAINNGFMEDIPF